MSNHVHLIISSKIGKLSDTLRDFKDEKLNYIHMNPVEAGLVNDPEHYRYSSTLDYAGGKGLIDITFL